MTEVEPLSQTVQEAPGDLDRSGSVDDSRPGRRRWCSVEVCGNRTNTARYRSHRAPA